jgi:uncharacterized membrane protein HdeD (DUF308 family)
MKPMALVGLVLIVAGIAALIYRGIPYTTRETVVDIGPIQATAERDRTLRLPMAVGALAIVGGVALVVAGGRKSMV